MSDTIIFNYSEAQDRYDQFKKFYNRKQLPQQLFQFDTTKTINENLRQLALVSLEPTITSAYLYSFDQIFLDLVSRWISDESIEIEYNQLNKQSNIINGTVILSSLAKIISLSPNITSLVEYYLENLNIFQNLETNQSKISNLELQQILLAFHRLLYHDQQRFIRFISPHTLTNILKFTEDEVVKFLIIQILSKYLNLTEKAKNDLLNNHITKPIIGSYESDKNIDYQFLSVLEAQRLANHHNIQSQSSSSNSEPSNSDIFINIENTSISSLVVSVCGVLVSKIHLDITTKTQSSLVPTERSIDTLRKLALNVQSSSPVMLVGNAGSGKTFLINELSKYLSCDKTIVKIHLGEQTDAKLLLGTYTSGQKPGTFEWRSGVLTTAVKEGRWVLIEDIDKAPTEVLSILLSLLEKRELTIPSRGEVIKAANGFQLISTIRTTNNYKHNKSSTIPEIIGLRLWNVLQLNDQSDDELLQILTSKFPILSKLIPNFIKLYESIQLAYNGKQFLSLNRGSQPRIISLRDLMKFCQRVDVLFQNHGVNSSSQLLESSVLDNIFAEAVDCFAGAISEYSALEVLINTIGEALQISSSRINLFISKHVPLYEDFPEKLIIGRAHLSKAPSSLYKKKNTGNNTSFARTNHSLKLMEQIGVSVQMTEPVLLVGETGTGKTTVVQQVAKQLNKELTVINVSQQTEAGDLLGGYKPVNTKSVAVPIQEEFENLFHLTFSMKKNEKFHKMLTKCFNKNQWKNVIRLWQEAIKLSEKVLNTPDEDFNDEAPKKKRRLNTHDKKLLIEKWNEFTQNVKNFEVQSSSLENSFVFNFVEGSLVKAVRNGDWLLLDEINLASPDTLESISDLLSDTSGRRSILLSEKGEVESIQAHKDFRIFACMNPATDVGKRDLPLSIRSRFTEVYVHSPDGDISDLLSIIDKYLSRFALNDEWIGNDVAQLYLEAKKLADSNQIVDGANQKPHFSIRTLTRTLLYVVDIVSIYGLRRSLYEGFCMSFLTLLDLKSEEILKPLIEKYTIHRLKNAKSVISQIPPAPSSESGSFVQFRHYWMRQGPSEIIDQPHYIITPFVEKNMMNLVRATSGRKFPILVQGPTSSGKTSMIKYLADITGHKFVRINNHEHTDLQEYLGTYISDDTGRLSFKEGVLVEALRNGHWLVLDELNLAPTDVLEALNRLLDDNRELFIPETQEVVRPHPDFMLFATQNPPGLYGGRKVLSRAFRNRFLELHFDDIPQDELEVILRDRCQIAPSYAKKIVEVYRQLSVQRQSSRLFEQKNSFATLRDLFRWALREAVGYEQLAANGYMLLAERVRKPEEKKVVQEVLEKVMRVKLDMNAYYNSLENQDLMNTPSQVVWTKAIRRLSVLISTALQNNEPILLVGETGCGKTTVCQLLAQFNNKKLITVNAHQNTETGDLLGAQRPVRNKSELQENLTKKVIEALQSIGVTPGGDDLRELLQFYDNQDLTELNEDIRKDIQHDRSNLNVLFEWSDGPLIQALNSGSYFLLDEISLADDSVLERLNSVLEPERTLLLAEKGTEDSSITAKDGFQFLATMNPGGDYGKKELSPALRNRFTEIWVPSMEDFGDVKTIVEEKLDENVKYLADGIVKFSERFGMKLGGGNITSGVISLRDILAWVEFINSTQNTGIPINSCLLNGASLVFIDALGTNNTAYLAESEEKLLQMKLDCVKELCEIAGDDLTQYYRQKVDISLNPSTLNAGGFEIARDSTNSKDEFFSFEAPTTAANTMRVVRAMQVKKPILLEGSPGVGKTSLVSALAKATGNQLTRINLSEQTDLVDLFGSDAPAEGGKTGEFVWRDAPFLRAMQRGEWVLLDEMNLASQSVLEGLNACLDHRGEAYIPELDRSFSRHPNFVVFAAQNPQYQGGGRKGLPKSFVNRFTVVYVDTLTSEDLVLIAHHLYPNINADTCSKMIGLMSRLDHEVCVTKSWGASGSPWEFNLRDTLRWLELYNAEYLSSGLSPIDFLNIIVTQRFRTVSDREKASKLVHETFEEEPCTDNYFTITESYFQAGKALMSRGSSVQETSHTRLNHLQSNTEFVESSLLAIQNNWPLIFVGSSSSGKTELVRYLATISSAKVVEFSMNSDIDSMDILGGYEQVDLTKRVTAIVEKFLRILNVGIADQLKNSSELLNTTIASLEFVKFLKTVHITIENFSLLVEHFGRFTELVRDNDQINEVEKELINLKELLKQSSSVKFEWFDGLLVKAVERGDWLILDNANLCSPSVLDRLNSLLEINGSLIMNECSMADGQARVLKPHPNFRLFLTVDPKFGELSRAMRNRGVEIYLDKLDHRATTFDRNVLGFKAKKSKKEELDLNELSLNENEPIAPIQKFIESTDSFSRSLSLVIDAIMTSGKEFMLNHLAGILPFLNQLSIERFTNTIYSSTEVTKEVIDALSEISSFVDYVTQLGLTKSIIGKFEDCENVVDSLLGQKSNFSINQSLNPGWNYYAIKRIQSNSLIPLNEAISLIQVASDLSQIEKALQSAEVRGANGKLNELSFLEQGAALSSGRNMKNPPKVNVFNFLKEIYEFILGSFKNKDTLSLLSQSSCFEALLDLTRIWKSVWDISDVKNEAKLRVYQKIINEWIEGATEFEGIDILKNIMKVYGNALKSDKGEYMSAIWESFRGVYPQSEQAWADNDVLSSLAEKFDAVSHEQFSESDNHILTLKSAILNIKNVILANDGSDISNAFTLLENGIRDLHEVSSKFLVKRAHNFEESFYLLFNMVLSSGSVKNEDIIAIAHQANISTTCLLKNTNTDSYPPVFNTLWAKTNNGYVSFVSHLFTNKFLHHIFINSQSYLTFSGNQVNQTVNDSVNFTKYLIKYSDEVSRDTHKEQVAIILNWYQKIVRIVSSDDSLSVWDGNSFDKNDLPQLSEKVAGISANGFTAINKNFFQPALELITGSVNIEKLGKAWVLFSIGLIQLYVPDNANDPAIEDHILYENYEKKKSLFTQLSNSVKNIRSVYFGDDEIVIEHHLPTVDEESKPSKPRVYRSKVPIDNLFEEWKIFMSSTLDNNSLVKFLATVEETELETLSGELNMFQQNSSNFIERLENQFSHFSDVNDIFKGYIYGIKLGFDLILEAKKKTKVTYNMDPLWFISFQNITNDKEIEKGLATVRNFCKNMDVDNTLAEQVMHITLKLASSSEQGINHQILEQVFQTIYYRWSLRRTRQEKKDAIEGSVFRYRGEEDEDEDFKKIFPDYDEYVELDTDSKSRSDSSRLDEEYANICKTYIDVFTKDKAYALKDLIVNGGDIAKKLISLSDEFETGVIDPTSLGSVISDLFRSIDSATIEKAGKDIDFYFGYSPPELRRSIKVVEKLQYSVHGLLQQWPEHATLQTLFRISQEYLAFPVKTPIARLIQKIEQIYTFIIEWEKYASVKVSLSAHQDDFTSLIVSWRRMELSSWKSLFKNEEISNQRSIGGFWFNLYENLILPSYSGVQIDIGQLVLILNSFISKSSYGQYELRLNLLKAIKTHLSSISSDKLLLNMLKNLIKYYEQFSPIIHENINRVKKTLEKDVEEVILLASWKDVNIDALKQSARRSHQSLYKVVRKYRTLLATEVTPLIEQGLPDSQKVSVNKDSVLVSKLELNADIGDDHKTIDGWDTRSQNLKQTETVQKNMNTYVSRVKNTEFPELYEFASDIVKESDRLRDDTPKTYSEENKKEVAALKTQKMKLLSDSIKELRRIGLKSRIREDIHKLQVTANQVLSGAEAFDNTQLEGSDAYFFRIVDILPRLRASVSSVAEDVPAAAAENGLAIIENLVYAVINDKKLLAKVAHKLNDFESDKSEFQKLIDSENLYVGKSTSALGLVKFNKICRWLPEILSLSMNLAATSSKMLQLSVDLSIFDSFVKKVSEFKEKIISQLKYSSIVDSQLAEFDNILKSFVSDLESWKSSNKSIGFVSDSVINWLNSLNDVEIEDSENQDTTVAEIEKTLRSFSNKVLVVFQKVIQSLSSEELTFDTDKWFIQSEAQLHTLLKSLHHESVHSSLHKALELVSSAKFDQAQSSQIRSLFSFTAPFLKFYLELVVAVLNKAKDSYIDISRSTYVFSNLLHNLTKNGFCSPEPPSETKQDENLHDGTGLGDGEGAQNNSNDVEDDEDLSEQAQEPNKDEKDDKDDEDDNQDAVDIEGDMAGDLENASDQDQDDDEEQDKDEEQDELDEEVDDLDDLDPNAVDDKMWDEEVQEDKKEKESENMPENSTADDMKAQEDEPEEKPEDKESKEDDKSSKDQENDDDKKEDDQDAEDEEDVGEQEDDVKNEEKEDLEQNVPEGEALDLPDDINLDSGEEDEEDDKQDDGDEGMDDGLDDKMDLDEDEAENGEEENVNDAEENQEEQEGEEGEEQESEEANQAGDENDQEEENQDQNDEEQDAIEAGEKSEDEEELKDAKNEEDQQDEAAEGEENGDRMEGIDSGETGDNNNEDIDKETATEEKSGDQGDGAQAQAEDEKEDVGASGSAMNQQQEDNDNDGNNDEARDNAQESLKQLGDSLKEFHRRHQDIREVSEKDETAEQAANERPDEFEHVDGENTEETTQALGAANKDQISSIDEDKAIDDDEDDQDEEIKNEDQDENMVEGEEANEDAEEIENQDDEKPDEFNGKTKGGFVGERKTENLDDMDDMDDINMDQNLDELDSDSDEDFSLLKPEVIDDDEDHRDIEEARELWRKSDLETQELSANLCEQLRLILEPTLSTKLKGDYKTGKRLNMKRIIPYIASEFRKDKIWLRRTKPSKRQYQIMIAVDDSKSMSESKSVDLAFQSIALVSKALTQLESGGLSIVKFGENTKVVHPFEKQFSPDTGAKIFQKFDFQQTRTDIKKLVGESIEIFNNAKSLGNSDLWQLQIIISDGVCEDHDTVQRLVRRAREERIMLVFVIIDGINSNESIMDMSQVSYVPDANGNMVLKVDKYLDSFPFEFYVVVHDITDLPKMLSLILRQYFSELASN
ncbi:Midasin [Wickerhamomyces ciferrii]|uniref:Midasin n=1 Tax=Wickerhamomyces ciferrii (strain ATCC 14091 / BCRC 22168 / CBS 111 / JCM 3599 / NBRC 0793 / NRRL Y-1031 F-60-10) TaxID=1206466 RepID=K0K907_WICCF|nr:Midasin [Wickerhamomyces ciferrii]CCH41350.1 Midasin [Wickerhamomyces ciferrii]